MGIVDIVHERELTYKLKRDVYHAIITAKELKPSRERALALTKLQEAYHWLMSDLETIQDAQGKLANTTHA